MPLYIYGGLTTIAPSWASGGGGGGFPPTSISGLQLWLDAKDPNNGGSVPSNGDIITSWLDKSTLGHNATKAGGSGGTTNIIYTTTGFNGGYPAMTFSSDRSATSASANLHYFKGSFTNTGSTMTIFIVYSAAGTYSVGRLISLGQANINDYGSTSYMHIPEGNGTNYSLSSNRNGGPSTVNTLTFDTGYLIEAWFDSTKNYITIQIGDSTSIVSSSSTGNFNITDYVIAYNVNYNDGNSSFRGYISEVLVYNTCVADSDRIKMEGYLSWKWGLSGKLPTGHLYKSAPP